MVSTTDDEARLYYTLFNVTAMGKPLLQQPESLRELVKPRTPLPGSNRSFAQGLWVMQGIPSPQHPWLPQVVLYEGETVCSHTANMLDTTTTPDFLMVQVWRSTTVYYTSEAKLEHARRGRGVPIPDVFDGWATTPHLMQSAWLVHDFFASRQQQNIQ
jgi:hypothetical protein